MLLIANFLWFLACRELMEVAEPQFKVPTRNTVKKYVNFTWPKLKLAIIEKLAAAEEVHITSDIWSTRACKASCLGVTVHFYSPVTRKRETFVIACREFSSPHTGSRIAALVKEIAEEFGILGKLRQVIKNIVNYFHVFQQSYGAVSV